MSLQTRITALHTRVAEEFKDVYQGINGGDTLDLSGLNTTAKGNLVAAINEVLLSAGNEIDDAQTSLTTTWSSTKINNEIGAVSNIANGAVRFDITQPLLTADKETARANIDAAYLDDTVTSTDSGWSSSKIDAEISAVETTAGNAVLFTAQTLTAPQQQQARDNIGVYSKDEIGNPETDFVSQFEAALAA